MPGSAVLPNFNQQQNEDAVRTCAPLEVSMNVQRTLGLAVVLAHVAATAGMGSTIIGVSTSSPGSLYSLNPLTGAASLLGSVGYTANGSDIDFLNGVLYATNIYNSNYMFGTLNATNGSYTSTVVSQSGSPGWNGLAAVSNGFYLVQNEFNKLYFMTPTGTLSSRGTLSAILYDLAWDANHSTLYGVDNNNLYKVNTATAGLTVVGSLGSAGQTSSLGLAFDNATDTLYLNNGNTRQLYFLNTATGAGTLIGGNGVAPSIDGLAVMADPVIPAPENETLVLLGGGVAMLLVRVRRHRS